MAISAQQTGSGLVLNVGYTRLDSSIADSFKSEVISLADKGARRINIDMSLVEFMDSSGLGALVGCMKHIGGNGTFEISNPTETVMKIFRLTRMNKVFTIHGAPPAP